MWLTVHLAVQLCSLAFAFAHRLLRQGSLSEMVPYHIEGRPIRVDENGTLRQRPLFSSRISPLIHAP